MGQVSFFFAAFQHLIELCIFSVPEATIVEALNGAKPSNLRAKCNTIALIARRLSTDVHHASPFAQKASEHGYSAHGGKPDDITLVILHIS